MTGERAGEVRYRLLETVRQYGREKLQASGETETTGGRHAQYYLKLAEEAEPELKKRQQVVWLARLEREHGNLRAAMRWLLAEDETDTAVRLAWALWLFCDAAIKIGLKGIDAGSDGLTIKASNVGIRGLAINRFASSGISIEGGLGARIEGNFIGTDPSGLQDLGNRSAGVDINGASGSGANTIGGDEPAERNLISGNDSEGVFIFNGSSANSLFGNYIGTKKDGTTAPDAKPLIELNGKNAGLLVSGLNIVAPARW